MCAKLLAILHLLFVKYYIVIAANDEIETVMIGAMLSSIDEDRELKEAIRILNTDSLVLPKNIELNVTSIVMNNNPIESALAVCEQLIPKEVYAVISSHAKDLYLSSVSVSYTCGFYSIPVIGISARESIFSDKDIHKSYLRTVPPYSHQAYVWADLVDYFKWTKVIVLTTDDQDGRSILTLLRRTLENHDMYKFQIERAIMFKQGETNMTSHLQQAKQCQSTVILLHASEKDAGNIYKEAGRLNMTRAGYAWVVTEQGLDKNALEFAPEGIIGIRLNGSKNSSAHILDAVKVAAQGYHSYVQYTEGASDVHSPPTNCRQEKEWPSGSIFYKNLIEVKIQHGAVGPIEFDGNGDMVSATYKIYNLQRNRLINVGVWAADDHEPIFDEYDYKKDEPDLNFMWPGGVTQRPEGFEIPMHLRVVSIRSHPFTYVKDPVSQFEKDIALICPDDGEDACCPEGSIPCTSHDGFGKCCSGFCMDLLQALAHEDELGFTYDVHLVDDNNYGSYERVNGSLKRQWTGLIGALVDGDADMIMAPLTINQERSKVIDFSKPYKYQGLTILIKRINGSGTKSWTGLMGELLEGRADMIVAPLTINQERSRVIDFSKPFKYQGLTILIKRPSTTSYLLQFLRPFEPKLWILIFACIHFVAVLLYLLDRFSPFSRPKTSHVDEPDSCNISQAVWFSWSVIMNSGIGDGTPRSFAARVLGVVWAGFAMIIVASYTANLAAYLVLDKPKGGISGINDARIRNPSSSFKYATVERSSVETYFRRQVELSSMYIFMKDKNYKNAEDAIHALKNDEIQAFIWDSAMLDYEAARDCSLVTVGELFGRSGFGIGLQRNSPWTSKVSLKILNFHEGGKMEKLDQKWIRQNFSCAQGDNKPKTLGMNSMGGVFILVAGGLLFSGVCIWVEIIYKRKQDARQRQLDLARVAVAHWRGTVKVQNNSTSKHQERRRGRANQLNQGSTAEKHNGVQGPAALEKEMDGAMPVSLLSRRHRGKNKNPHSSRMNNASGAIHAKAIYGDIELKERV